MLVYEGAWLLLLVALWLCYLIVSTLPGDEFLGGLRHGPDLNPEVP